MRLLIIFVLQWIFITAEAAPQANILHENVETETFCNQNDKNEYLLCIQNYNKKLHKRESISPDDISRCNTLRTNCIQRCGQFQKCLDLCPMCPTVVNDYRKVKVEEHIGYGVKETIDTKNIHSNLNESSTEGGSFGLGFNHHGSCCIVVQPKVCQRSSTGFRCHHKRHRTCGSHCTSRLIQAGSTQNSEQQCRYISNWPFLDCRNDHEDNCEGCYDEYGYSYAENTNAKCSKCPDKKVDTYQRGPMFPQYYYQPMMIPVLSFSPYPLAFPQQYSPFNAQPYSSQFYPGHNSFNPEFNSDNDEFDSESIDDEVSKNTETTENNWSVTRKCKVVGVDGKVYLNKCLYNEETSNPFARLPGDRLAGARRYNRNIANNNNNHSTRNRAGRSFRRQQRHPTNINKRNANIIYDD